MWFIVWASATPTDLEVELSSTVKVHNGNIHFRSHICSLCVTTKDPICEMMIKPETQSKLGASLVLIKALQPNRPSVNVIVSLCLGKWACAILVLTQGSCPLGGKQRLSQMSAWSHCSAAPKGPSWTLSSLWSECSRPCTLRLSHTTQDVLFKRN